MSVNLKWRLKQRLFWSTSLNTLSTAHRVGCCVSWHCGLQISSFCKNWSQDQNVTVVSSQPSPAVWGLQLKHNHWCLCSLVSSQTCPQKNYTPPHRRTFSTRMLYNVTGHNVETYILATTKDFLQKRYGMQLQSFSLLRYEHPFRLIIIPLLKEGMVWSGLNRTPLLIASVNLVEGGKMH